MVLKGKVVSCKLHCWLPIVSFMINVNSQIFKPFEMHVKGKIIKPFKMECWTCWCMHNNIYYGLISCFKGNLHILIKISIFCTINIYGMVFAFASKW